jgi:RimJ/RimL family protein N-acetyltransferase
MSPNERTVTLRDGSRVLVRPIAPGDKPAMRIAFRRLSAHSRELRFLAYKKRLTNADLAYFSEVDHSDHEALVAVDARNGDIVGIARYVRLPGDGHAAEPAVMVVDDWQGRGVGTVLMRRLADRAQDEGIRRFEAQALSENHRVIELFKKIGRLDVRHERGIAELLVALPERGADRPPHVRSLSPID